MTVKVTPTIADGQQTAAIGVRNCEIISRSVDEVVGVSDPEIVATMKVLFERLKVVVEPSGASALAAIVAGRIDASGQRVGVTLSGGNIDIGQMVELKGAAAP